MLGPAIKTEQWYDRRSRSWVVRKLDAEGNQVGNADYSGTRAGAEAAKEQFEREIAEGKEA